MVDSTLTTQTMAKAARLSSGELFPMMILLFLFGSGSGDGDRYHCAYGDFDDVPAVRSEATCAIRAKLIVIEIPSLCIIVATWRPAYVKNTATFLAWALAFIAPHGVFFDDVWLHIFDAEWTLSDVLFRHVFSNQSIIWRPFFLETASWLRPAPFFVPAKF